MMKCVWLLLLCPWLVLAPLGSTPTRSHKTPTTDSWKCPESYAWDEHVNDCIPCSVCIFYPLSQFCSTCPEFISHVPVTTTPTVYLVGTFPSVDSEVNLESSGRHPPPPEPSTTSILVAAGGLITALLILLTIAATFWRAWKRTKLRSNRSPPPKNSKVTFDVKTSKVIISPDEPFNSSPAQFFSPRPPPNIFSLDEPVYSSKITNSQMPHNVPDRQMSDSDSDISLGTCKTGSSSADSGYCTTASASCITVPKMSQWEKESCVNSRSVILQACSKNPSAMSTRLSGYYHNDPGLTIPTIAQKPLKKSVHFAPYRHTFLSDSDSDISMGNTQHDGGAIMALSSPGPIRIYVCDNMPKVSQWDLEESCDESSSESSKSTNASSGCNSVVFFAEALIGQDGGILMLPNAVTSLLFSPHSIANQIDITLEILHNPVVLPELREDETLVSPFVFCGPHGWTFHKPVLLTFPHCGMSDRDDFTLLVTETSSQQAPDWMEVSSATPGIEYFIRDSECLVYTSHFTGFSLKSKGPKQVRLLAFSSLSDHLYRLRVYCINDTKDVIDYIEKREEKFGFKPTDGGIPMTFLNNKHDLHLKANLETPGWKFLGSSELVINYESVQRNRDGNVMFNLQAEAELKKDKLIIPLSIHVSQEGNSDSPTYRIAEELPVAQSEMQSKSSHTKDIGHKSHHSCDHKGACNCKTRSQMYMVHSADITNQTFLNSLVSHRSKNLTIPHKLRTELCTKLDPKKDCGKGWRSLARELGLDDLIEYFDSNGHLSPTEMVLQEFDMSGKTLKDLKAILIGIGRPDAASLVQEHLQNSSCDLPGPFTDSGVESPNAETSERDRSPSPGSDKKFFPNSPSRAGERNSPQDMRVYAHELSNFTANTELEASASERDGPHADKKFFVGGSIPSDELYGSSTNLESSERDSPPSIDSNRHEPSGESDHSHDSHNSSQDETEPKDPVHAETSETGSMLALERNITASDSDETGNVEAEEVNDSSIANSEMSQDDQECTEVMVVSIPGPEVEHSPGGRRETAV